jgi:hypothetical protein
MVCFCSANKHIMKAKVSLICVPNSEGNEVMHHVWKRIIMYNKLHGEVHTESWYEVVLQWDTPNTTLMLATQ